MLGISTLLQRIEEPLRRLAALAQDGERTRLLIGSQLARQVAAMRDLRELRQAEFSVFSQWGDDGIIQWLIAHLDIPSKTFVEFGVEDYRESNTRFLLMNNNWRGLVMDGSKEHIATVRAQHYYWRHDLQAIDAFITRENIDDLIAAWRDTTDIGLLHIDLDGNDYWVWDAIHCVQPRIVIVEYNSVFGAERAITVPYDAHFQRFRAHKSGLFWGASLAALTHLAEAKGYVLVGSNSAGNNAYFVRKDVACDLLPALTATQAYVESRYRESRDSDGRLTFLAGPSRLDTIRGQAVWNVGRGLMEAL